MRTRPTVIYFSPADRPVPEHVVKWIGEKELSLVHHVDRKAVESIAIRNPPLMVMIDADGDVADGLALCETLKADAYTAVVPVTLLASCHPNEQVGAWFEAGADEIITPLFEKAEQRSRLEGLLLRTERNVSVHPKGSIVG